jgi:hypothetical protein
MSDFLKGIANVAVLIVKSAPGFLADLMENAGFQQ